MRGAGRTCSCARLGLLSGVSTVPVVTATLRRIYHEPLISLGRVPRQSSELHAVSAAWLLIGIVVLVAGVRTGRRDLRLASAALLVAITLKVFLMDMGQLDGALRAASFIGLGVVLLAIGRVYQRLLAKPETPA